MRLSKATIEGYRSIREAVEVHLDPSVTVILGANDHGKSNLLEALRHLNDDHPFDAEVDLNWDCLGRDAEFPSVRYELTLDDEDVSDLRELERLERERAALEEFLDSASRELEDAEDSASPARGGVEEVKQASEEAAEELKSAKESREAAPDDETAVERLKEAQAQATKLKRELSAAENALVLLEEAVQASRRRVSRAQARLIEVAARTDNNAAEDPVVDALREAQDALRLATQYQAKTLRAKQEADEKLEQGSATYGQGTAELEELQRAATTAAKQHQTAVHETAARQREVTDLENAAEANAGHASGDPDWAIPLPTADAEPLAAVPTTVIVSRVGVAGELEISDPGFGEAVFADFVVDRTPRVEIIQPVDKVLDSVTRKELETEDAVFMRGIFDYAGIFPAEWDTIFSQDGVTTRRLDDASGVLDETLRKSWRQGSKLGFRLQHNSRQQRIELWIVDPAVQTQWVKASRRSSGFTHFFALKTILHAHETEAPARSYLWLFDEPGVYLHPDGQQDLVQVMETLGRSNQLVYSTHSVFMANKNFPTRHRLVLKTVGGTKIDGKPFRSRWRPAIEALGMSLPGSFLFASRVLLVEGDSDSILINATLQTLLELGEFERDVNSLAIMGAGDPADAAALVRILTESATAPEIAALFDGDDGGARRKQALEPLAEQHKIPIKLLMSGTTTEDHLFWAAELYPRALATYLAKMSPRRDDDGNALTVDQYLAEIEPRLVDLETTKDGLTKGLAEWSRELGRELGDLEYKPSPSGVAREYVALLREADRDELKAGNLKRPRDLAKWVASTLELPALTLKEDAILEEEVIDAEELA